MRKRGMHIVVLLVSLTACGKRVTQEQLVHDAVDLKLYQWQQSERKSCRDRAMAKAEAYVDSFLLANSLTSRLDTIPKPPKPIKPERPPIKEKPDSVKVDKLFKDE